MKKKPIFSQIIFVIILGIVCLLITVGSAFIVGSVNVDIFDFKNINFSNMIPILLIGGFISCVVVGISILYLMRSVFYKAKDFLNENDKKTRGKEK